MSRQVSENYFEDIEQSIEHTITKITEIKKRIDDLNNVLDDQKKLKSQCDVIVFELDQLKHTASS